MGEATSPVAHAGDLAHVSESDKGLGCRIVALQTISVWASLPWFRHIPTYFFLKKGKAACGAAGRF